MIIDLTGKVEPCCYFSGYANSGLPLGNVNEQSVLEIWNGEGYQNIRRLNAVGEFPDDHPCHPDNCMAKRTVGVYPIFHVGSVNISKQGYGYVIPIPEFLIDIIAATGDAPCLVYEDDLPLSMPDAIHADVYEKGYGRYSVWGNWLYLSSSDGSDPCENGRKYTFRYGHHQVDVPLPFRLDCPSGRNIAAALKEYQAGVSEMLALPTSIQVASTADCNIDCPHCFQNIYRTVNVQLRPSVMDEVISLVPYLQEFMWFGGEPYFVKAFRDFIDRFTATDNPNLCFGFTTNGTMLNQTETEKLLKFPRLNAAVSVDSFVPATFERVRKGANFDRVSGNLKRIVDLYDRSQRIITVGMTVLKSTMDEIALNVRAAIEADIPINLSPCLVYPLHERLDVYHHFDEETVGWRGALLDAVAVVQQAREAGRKAILRNDIEGSLHELLNYIDQARIRYSRVVRVRFHVTDSYGSLSRMRLPAIVVSRVMAEAQPLSVITIDGPGEYELCLPVCDLSSPNPPFWYLTDDINYEGWVLMDQFRQSSGECYAFGQMLISMPSRVNITVPDFTPIPIARNAVLAKEAQSRPGRLISSMSELSVANRASYAERHDLLLPGESVGSSAMRRSWDARNVAYSEYVTVTDDRLPAAATQPHSLQKANSTEREWIVDATSIRHESGYAWIASLPECIPFGDDVSVTDSSLVLLENGQPLGMGHASHADIRAEGRGKYSHWRRVLYFSTSDNSSPCRNGRIYSFLFMSEDSAA